MCIQHNNILCIVVACILYPLNTKDEIDPSKMATLRAASRAGVVITKCRHQSTATVIDAATVGDEAALPFEDVPTFKTTKWPLVGQLRQLTQIEPELYKKYGFTKGYKLMNGVRRLTGGRDIFKYYAPMFNPHGNGYVVYLFEPSQMEHVLRNEGKYPCRGPAFEFLGVLRYLLLLPTNNKTLIASNYLGIPTWFGSKLDFTDFHLGIPLVCTQLPCHLSLHNCHFPKQNWTDRKKTSHKNAVKLPPCYVVLRLNCIANN